MEGKSIDLSMQAQWSLCTLYGQRFCSSNTSSQATCDEFTMFLKQGIIKYHTKPEDDASKALLKAERAQKLATARLKTSVLPESQ